MGMHFELNRETLKAMQNEAGHTVLEKTLLEYIDRIHKYIGKIENEKNDLKLSLISIYNRIPCWIPDEAAKNRSKSAPSMVAVIVPKGVVDECSFMGKPDCGTDAASGDNTKAD